MTAGHRHRKQPPCRDARPSASYRQCAGIQTVS